MTVLRSATSVAFLVLTTTALLGGCASPTPEGEATTTEAAPVPPSQRTDEAVRQAEALQEQGLLDAALAEFERAIAINPDLTVAYLGAGDIHAARGDYPAAEASYAAATRLEPRNFDAHYGRGLMLQLMDRVSDAIRSYLRALTIRPDDFDANLNLATAYLQLDEPGEALAYAQRAVDLDTSSGPARVNLAAIYKALGYHEEAVIEYQQAMESMELSTDLMLNLADSLGKVKRYEEMAVTCEQLIRTSPSAIAFERLGSARFRLRQYRSAEEAFERAMDLDPAHYPALNGKAVCLLNHYVWSERADTSALREAVSLLRRSLQIERNQPRITELLSRYG